MNRLTNQVWTLQGLIDHCIQFQPEKAAQRNDSRLCVSELITHIEINGEIVELGLVEGRWAGTGVRVSSERQRSSKSGKKVADGYSEEYQLRRNIEWCVAQRLAFKVYSDAGVTSTYPPNKPDLILDLLQAKADRYKKVFDRIWLAKGPIAERTPEEVKAMIAYRDRKIEATLSGPYTDDKEPPRQGRKKKKAYHRQALTQLWDDMEAGLVHTVVVTDKSRLFRGADLEKRFLELAHKRCVKLQGTEETIIDFDITDPMQKGMVYLLGCTTEKKLEEVSVNAMKGYFELLRSGRPLGCLPFWLERDKHKHALLVEGADAVVLRIIDMFLNGYGRCAISNRLFHEGVTVQGKSISAQMVETVINTDAAAGIQEEFGLRWEVLPRLIDDDTLADMRAMREKRKDNKHQQGFGGEKGSQPNHIFTGIAFCECGYRCGWHNGNGTPTGYVVCGRPHRGSAADHAFFPQDHLAAFLDEILPHLEQLSELSNDQSERLARAHCRDEAMHHLTLQITKAEEALARKTREAQENAEQNVAKLGVTRDAPDYDTIVAGVADVLVTPDRKALGVLQARLTALQQQASADRSTARIRAKMADVSDWLNLSDVEKNLVLKGIFDRIVLSRPSPYRKSTPGPDGTVTFYLKDIETPLPPVRMYRGGITRRALFLQKPAEWLADIFDLPYEPEPEEEPKPKPFRINSSDMRAFLTFLRRYHGNGAVGELAEAVRADKGQLRCRVVTKKSARAVFEARGYSDTLLMALNEAWELFLEGERDYVFARLRHRGVADNVIEEAWGHYLSVQRRNY